MNILDEYIEELKQDTLIDEFTVKDVQMKLPSIKHKWAGRLIRAKIRRNDLYRDRKKQINVLTTQLIKQSPVKLSYPVASKKVEDIDTVLEFDDKIKDVGLEIEFLEKAEKILNSMTFDIRNITEIIKLETQ